MSAAYPTAQRTEGFAIASLVLGIVGLVAFPVIPSILAIVFGVSAKRRIRQDARLTGEGLATAGIVLGIVELVLVALGVAALIFAISHAHGTPMPPSPTP
jgi:hypothetical protein